MVGKQEEDVNSNSEATEIPIPLEDLSLNKNEAKSTEWDIVKSENATVEEKKKFHPIS